MNQKTYSEIVAKRPELAVDGLVCNEATVIPGGWNVSANRPLVRAPHFVYVGDLISDTVAHALIFKHWTEMLPQGYYVFQVLGGGFMVRDDHDDWCLLRPVATHLDALAEFWRTYEGG